MRRALASLRARDPAPGLTCGTSPFALRGEGRTARPSCDREPTCPPTRQRRLQVLKGQPPPRLTLRVSPYACPELPHFLSEGTILTIYLAFPASFSTVDYPRNCPDLGPSGRSSAGGR